MEFIILGTQQQLQKIGHINIQVGENLITPMDIVCNFGLFKDKYLKIKITPTGLHPALTTHSERCINPDHIWTKTQ